MADNLTKIKEIFTTVNDGISKEEFVANFKTLIEFVKQMKVANTKEMAALNTKYTKVVSDLTDNLKSTSEAEVTKAKSLAMDYCMKEMTTLTKQVNDKLTTIKNGVDGKTPDVTDVAREAATMAENAIKPLLPTIEQIEADLPKLGQPIRDSLELLPDGEKTKIEAIQDLRETLDRLEREIKSSGNSKTIYIGGQQSGGRIMKVIDLSDQLNGVLTTFSLPAFWRVISVQASSNPGPCRPTVDYTTDAAACTLSFTNQIDPTSTLATGQTLIVTYSE